MKSDYYDQYWTDEGFNLNVEIWPELADLYQRLLPAGGRVLDLGCGDGGTSGLWLRDHGFEYVGADVSPAALRRATDRGLAVRQLEVDAPLPFEDTSFDSVVCIEVLEHLFSPVEMAREAKRVLKRDGIFICTLPNCVYWRSRLNLVLGRFDPLGDSLSRERPWRDPHIRFFSPTTISAMLSTAGFRDVRVEGQRGGVLNDLPYVGRRRAARHASAFYRSLERRRPSVFGYSLAAYGRG